MKHCLVFASLISPSKMILFEKKYQSFDTVFHHQMKHLEVRQKYSAARRIFNSLLGVSSGDETLHLMFDILHDVYFTNACSSCKVKLCKFQWPSSFFLILKKTSHTSFCFFETSKLVSPQFLLFILFCFREKNAINFVYMRLPELRLIARITMARCTREAKFEAVQRHYIKIYQSNFLLCYIKFIPV